MDHEQTSAGTIGDKKEKSDEMLRSQSSQTSASESGAEASEQTEDIVGEHDVEIDCKSGPATALFVSRPCSVEGRQPKSLHSLLPPFKEIHRLPDVSQSLTKTRGQDSLKTSSAHAEAGSDLCAAILLSCLFCRPLDCLLETCRGCTVCLCSLSSSVCGCQPVALQPLLEFGPWRCPGAGRFLCDCSGCNICLPAAECLDLAMEISQMLNH